MNYYQKIKIPYLDKRFIKNKADSFRKKYHGPSIPVDIVKIVEIKLKINTIPIPDIRKNHAFEALITSF